MCTNSQKQLKRITDEISKDVKKVLGERLNNIILYGSDARGYYNDESDIDIMVLADVKDDEIYSYRKIIRQISNNVSLEYGTTVSLSLNNKKTFESRINILPTYKNVITEGINIYG